MAKGEKNEDFWKKHQPKVYAFLVFVVVVGGHFANYFINKGVKSHILESTAEAAERVPFLESEQKRLCDKFDSMKEYGSEPARKNDTRLTALETRFDSELTTIKSNQRTIKQQLNSLPGDIARAMKED